MNREGGVNREACQPLRLGTRVCVPQCEPRGDAWESSAPSAQSLFSGQPGRSDKAGISSGQLGSQGTHIGVLGFAAPAGALAPHCIVSVSGSDLLFGGGGGGRSAFPPHLLLLSTLMCEVLSEGSPGSTVWGGRRNLMFG